MSAQRTAYWRCPACGYAVTISNRWSRAGVPRCLNTELQESGAKCTNLGKPLDRREQRPAKEPEIEQASSKETHAPDEGIQPMGQVVIETEASPHAAEYKSKRYRILTELNGMTHEEALKDMEEEGL